MAGLVTAPLLVTTASCADDGPGETGASSQGGHPSGGAPAGAGAGAGGIGQGGQTGGGGSVGGGGQGGAGGGPTSPTGPSAGCGTPFSAGVTTGSIMVGGTARTYLLVLPDTPVDTPVPLVFAWHGNNWTGQSLRDGMPETWGHHIEDAWGAPAIYVYPNGLSVDGLPEAAAGGVTGTGWDWRPDGRDVAFFDTLYATITQSHCVDLGRVFSLGRSHGGLFSQTLACERSNLVARTATVCGGLPAPVAGPLCKAEHERMYIIHNIGDPVVPYAAAVAARDLWLDRNGCGSGTSAVDPSPCVASQGCAAEEPLFFCAANANDHTPPSFTPVAIAGFFAAP